MGRPRLEMVKVVNTRKPAQPAAAAFRCERICLPGLQPDSGVSSSLRLCVRVRVRWQIVK